MSDIKRWTIEGRDEDERTLINVAGPTIPSRAQRGMVLESNYDALAEQLRGAVDEIERLRGVIRDMKSLMPIVRRHAEQVTEWANEVLDPPTPGGQ